MKKIFLLVLLVTFLSACGSGEHSTNDEKSSNIVSYPNDAQVEADDFVYRLYTEKDIYDEFNETAIFAELSYIGDQESVEISHSASPFEFPIEELTRDIKVDYAMEEPLIRTVLIRDEPFREKYHFAGGYSDQDDKETIDFIQTIIKKGFPEGNYLINGTVNFFIENTDEKVDPEHYKFNLDISFNVKK